MPISLVNDKADNAYGNGLGMRAAPKYSITRGEDDALQWEPPIRSRELANALSYRYPLEQSLQEMMQRAILDFLDSEDLEGKPTLKEIKENSKPPVPVQSQILVTSTDNAGQVLSKPAERAMAQTQSSQSPEVFEVWDIKTGASVKPKGRKRGLSPTTRQRVAENRGNTCAYHRKAKTQCDPTQCRQNKLYPGTAIESNSTKRIDQRKRSRKEESPNEESSISSGTPETEPKYENHPLKRAKGPAFLSPNMPKSVNQLEDAQSTFGIQDCRNTRAKPSLEEESAHIASIPFSNFDGFLGAGSLFDGSENHATHLAGTVSGSLSGSRQISEGSKLFPSISNMNINLDLDTAAIGRFSIENNMDLQNDWPLDTETFGTDSFNWIEDLMASDLPLLEHDWPREDAGATATLTDISSSPKTLLDWSGMPIPFTDLVAVEPVDLGFQSSANSILYKTTKNFNGYLQNYSGYSYASPSPWGSPFQAQASGFAISKEQNFEDDVGPSISTSPDVDWSARHMYIEKAIQAPTLVTSQEERDEHLTEDEMPRDSPHDSPILVHRDIATKNTNRVEEYPDMVEFESLFENARGSSQGTGKLAERTPSSASTISAPSLRRARVRRARAKSWAELDSPWEDGMGYFKDFSCGQSTDNFKPKSAGITPPAEPERPGTPISKLPLLMSSTNSASLQSEEGVNFLTSGTLFSTRPYCEVHHHINPSFGAFEFYGQPPGTSSKSTPQQGKLFTSLADTALVDETNDVSEDANEEDIDRYDQAGFIQDDAPTTAFSVPETVARTALARPYDSHGMEADREHSLRLDDAELGEERGREASLAAEPEEKLERQRRKENRALNNAMINARPAGLPAQFTAFRLRERFEIPPAPIMVPVQYSPKMPDAHPIEPDTDSKGGEVVEKCGVEHSPDSDGTEVGSSSSIALKRKLKIANKRGHTLRAGSFVGAGDAPYPGGTGSVPQSLPGHSRNASLAPESTAFTKDQECVMMPLQFTTHRRSQSRYSNLLDSSAAPSPNLVRQDTFESAEQHHSQKPGQERVHAEQSRAHQEVSLTSLRGDISPLREEDVISIEVLTTLLRDSGLNLTESADQAYRPKDESSLADIILIEATLTTSSADVDTPPLYRDLLVDGLRLSDSRLRLINATCNMDVKEILSEASSEQSISNAVPSASETGSPAKHRIQDHSRNLHLDYIRSISDLSASATTDPNGERPLTIIYRSKSTRTFVKRAMVTAVDPSKLSPQPPSYNLRWVDLKWRTIESMISDLHLPNIVIPSSLGAAKPVGPSEFSARVGRETPRPAQRPPGFIPVEEKLPNLPMFEKAAPANRVTERRQDIGGREESVEIVKAQVHARRRNPNKLVLLFEGPVDAVKSLWKKMSKMKI